MRSYGDLTKSTTRDSFLSFAHRQVRVDGLVPLRSRTTPTRPCEQNGGGARTEPRRDVPEDAQRARSAVDCDSEGRAGLDETHGVESALSLDQVCLGNDTKIVEACDTVGRHAVAGSESKLGGDVSDCSCHRGGKHAVQDGNRCCPSHHEKGPTTDVFELTPPDLTSPRLGHHGSSAMASRIEAIAAKVSASVGGLRS